MNSLYFYSFRMCSFLSVPCSRCCKKAVMNCLVVNFTEKEHRTFLIARLLILIIIYFKAFILSLNEYESSMIQTFTFDWNFIVWWVISIQSFNSAEHWITGKDHVYVRRIEYYKNNRYWCKNILVCLGKFHTKYYV